MTGLSKEAREKKQGLERRTGGAWGRSDQAFLYDRLKMFKEEKKQLMVAWLQRTRKKEEED